MKYSYLLGLTPQRRDFHYPRVLDRTERHSILLEDFRKEYDINMATETPLPDTSFTSQATEVRSPLTIAPFILVSINKKCNMKINRKLEHFICKCIDQSVLHHKSFKNNQNETVFIAIGTLLVDDSGEKIRSFQLVLMIHVLHKCLCEQTVVWFDSRYQLTLPDYKTCDLYFLHKVKLVCRHPDFKTFSFSRFWPAFSIVPTNR